MYFLNHKFSFRSLFPKTDKKHCLIKILGSTWPDFICFFFSCFSCFNIDWNGQHMAFIHSLIHLFIRWVNSYLLDIYSVWGTRKADTFVTMKETHHSQVVMRYLSITRILVFFPLSPWDNKGLEKSHPVLLQSVEWAFENAYNYSSLIIRKFFTFLTISFVNFGCFGYYFAFDLACPPWKD